MPEAKLAPCNMQCVASVVYSTSKKADANIRCLSRKKWGLKCVSMKW